MAGSAYQDHLYRNNGQKRFTLAETALPRPTDAWAEVRLSNGKSYQHEFYYGASYLSQEARALKITSDVIQVKKSDYQGKSRRMALPPPNVLAAEY